MFKKAVKVSAQNQLSGKDKKLIKSKVVDVLDNECVQKIFTDNEKIICCKIQGSKMLIYNGEDYPIFVDGTGKNNYFPSLYVAMAYQPLIKSLVINEGVETYIFNGANLMWPGVRNFQGLGDFKKDETVGIRNSKGEMIAIGAMGCNKKDMASDNSGVAVYILHYLGDKLWEMGTKNIPQIIIPLKVQAPKQQVKPQIQKEQPKKQEPIKAKVQQTKKQEKGKKYQKDTGKNKKQKSPQPKKPKTPQPSEDQSDDDDDNFMNLVHSKKQPEGRVIKMQAKPSAKNAFIEDENQQKNAKNKKKPAQDKGKKGGKKKQQSQQEDVMQQQQQPQPKKGQKDNKKGGKKKGGKQDKKQKGKKKQQSDQGQSDGQKKQKSDNQEKQEKVEQKSAINTKLMDEYFRQSFLNAIKLSKIQSQLPIDSGRFFMDFMLLARPEGVKLEIKDSSFKKIGKFFEEMAKKKFIEYKHPKDKKAQGAQITKIFWENQDLKNHVPTIKKLGSKQEQQKVESYSKAKLKLSKTVTLQSAYKPSQDLFNEVLKKPLNLMPAQGEKQVTDQQQIQYVTEKELRQKIEKYINKIVDGSKEKEKEKQVKKVQKSILIDYSKYNFLKDLLKKQIEEYEENKEKQDLLKAEEGSEDEEDKKKKKGKKGASKELLKVERHYLVEKLMKKATAYYHVFDEANGLDLFKQGTFKGIQITAEKANNKNVTRISGLELFITPKNEADEQIHGFAHTLQTKFACSVNVQNLPGKNAGKEIIVHGAFLDELEDMFTGEYELPSKFITTLNKLDKKKKN